MILNGPLQSSFNVIETRIQVTTFDMEIFLKYGYIVTGIVLLAIQTGFPVEACGGTLRGNICIVYVGSQSLKWQEARDYCRTVHQGDLLSIEDGATQLDIERLMRQDSATLVWTGGHEYLSVHWAWITENATAQQQGCFNNKTTTPEFTFTPNPKVENATSSVCIPVCLFHGYKYAALQGGTECFCGNSFGASGASEHCTMECAGDSTEVCGGQTQYSVHYPGGTYAGWKIGQPNNFNGNQYCAAFSKGSTNGLIDEPCDRAYPYICDVPESACQDINLSPTEGTYHTLSIGRCYFVSSSERLWFSARQQCLRRAGDLAQLTNPYLQEEMLTITVDSSNTKWWIGLTKIDFQWPTGPMVYTNFTTTSSHPSSRPEECVQISASDNYQWSDKHCDLSRNFYCQFDITKVSTSTPISTSTTTPTTIPTTTTPTPTTTTTTTPTTTTILTTVTATTKILTTTPISITPTTTLAPTLSSQASTASTTTEAADGSAGANNGVPEAAQATDGSSTRTIIIVFLVIFIILVILTIIGIIIVVMLRRRNAKRKAQQPNKFIPYTSQVDVTEYMSAPAFKVPNPPPDKQVKFSKASHATQTPAHNSANNYTKHMALQRDGTVSDMDSGISDAAIRREQKAKSKPPHTPIVYHESETPKRKHSHYTQNRVISPSGKTSGSDTGFEHTPKMQVRLSPMHDSDSNVRSNRRRSNKVNHSDNELTDDGLSRHRTVDFVTDSEDGRESRLYRVDNHPERNHKMTDSSRRHDKLDKPKARHDKHSISDTDANDDAVRQQHRGPVAKSANFHERKTPKPLKPLHEVKQQNKGKQRSAQRHSEDEETDITYRDPEVKSDRDRRGVSTTDDSEAEIKKVAMHMKVFLETDDEENPAAPAGGSKRKKLKKCPECHQNVRMLWKHLVKKHGMSPGSTELQQAMEKSKTIERKAGDD